MTTPPTTHQSRKYLEPLPTPKRVLITYAHPDDAEFFAGGTLAKWAQDGAHITLYLLTSGDKGSGDLELLNHNHLIEIREAEARAAAKILGIRDVIFERLRDGELVNELALRRRITRMIRLKQPDAVMSSDPLVRDWDGRRINHPDHSTVAEAVQGAFYPAARDHLNFIELYQDEELAPHKTRWLYLALSNNPNYQVETTDYRDTQINALLEHKSQIGELQLFMERMKDRYDKALTKNEAHPRYAEYFRVIDLERP